MLADELDYVLGVDTHRDRARDRGRDRADGRCDRATAAARRSRGYAELLASRSSTRRASRVGG